MQQLREVNETLWAELASNGIVEGNPVGDGVRRALGVGPGETGDAESHPVYAFTVAALSLAADAPFLILFLATPGRLVRYEWTKAGASTTTIPLDRIASIEDLEVGPEYAVVIHVDGHTRLHAGSSETRPGPGGDGPAQVTAYQERSEGLTYRIAATAADEVPVLAEFSRRLRLLLGA